MTYHIFGTTFNYYYHIFGMTFTVVHHIFGTTFSKRGLIIASNLFAFSPFYSFTFLPFYSFTLLLFYLFTLKISKNPPPLACFR